MFLRALWSALHRRRSPCTRQVAEPQTVMPDEDATDNAMRHSPLLSIENVAKLPFFVSNQGTSQVALIKTSNHVFRIRMGNRAFYLKAHTKDWYSDAQGQTGHVVLREKTAWQVMAGIGLPTPEVVAIDESADNAIGSPYIVTAELRGEPLTEILAKTSQGDAYEVLRAVGAYLRRMHSISFERPGILTPEGPAMGDWQHRFWSYHGFRTFAEEEQADAREELPDHIFRDLLRYIDEWQPGLKGVFDHPKFVHGDCHAHQFYVFRENGQWTVSGVLDMEVSSAGDCGEDFLKFCAEMSRRYEAEMDWWVPLFDGYGQEPDFQLLKLRYLASGHLELSPYAYRVVPGVRELVVLHVLRANDWRELFDLGGIRERHGKADAGDGK